MTHLIVKYAIFGNDRTRQISDKNDKLEQGYQNKIY